VEEGVRGQLLQAPVCRGSQKGFNYFYNYYITKIPAGVNSPRVKN
jgi:hypothetical protein